MNDLISRQAAIDALWAERMKHDEEMERNLETCSFALRADNKARRNRVEEDIEIIRQLPPAQFATDTNVGTKLGTNLAEVGKDVPDINVGELISRQDAIDALRKMQTYKLFSGDDMLLIDQAGAMTELMMLPPAEPKRGRWIYCEDSTADCVDGYRCDQCGFFAPWDYQHKSIDYIKDYHFCPNCGADMRGEDNETD